MGFPERDSDRKDASTYSIVSVPGIQGAMMKQDKLAGKVETDPESGDASACLIETFENLVNMLGIEAYA